MPAPVLDPALLARIGAAPVAVALSGGPDSVALLALATDALPGRVAALTVDHRLRPESAAEAAAAAALAHRLGARHATLVWDAPRPGPAAARAARYRLLRAWCEADGIRWLMTAHHADDQAETLLMRLARGAGPAGLAGIRAARPLGPHLTLIRPLLQVAKAALVALCAARALPFVTDPSNSDHGRARTRIRALLAREPGLPAAALARSAAALADAEAALAWAADRAWAGRATHGEGWACVDAAGLPRALRLRLLARAIAHAAPGPPPRGPDLDRLLATLDAGDVATLGGAGGAADGPRGGAAREGRPG